MVDRRSRWLLLPRPVRQLPADLVAMLVLTALVNVAVFAPLVRETPLRIPLGLAFVLFVPGYVFIAALFPEAGESPTAPETDAADSDDDDSRWNLETLQRTGIDGIERVALAFGLSIAIVPLIGLGLNFTPWGIRLTPIMGALTGFTIIATAIATIRRWELPEDERFRVPYTEWYHAGRRELLEPETRFDGLLNVLLVLSILLAVGTVTFAIVVPPQGEQFSAIYVLTEDDDGDLVAAGYPTNLTYGESEELIIGIDNNEHRAVEYTIVALEQTVETEGNETVVTEQRELDRIETSLAHNDSTHQTYDLEPTLTGEDIRIQWLLYPDEVPDDPSPENTEYSIHLWVDVNEPSD